MAIQKITSGILADGAIVAADIANGSITTAKIADGNVTSAKIDTVANTKITGLVTASQIANVANTQVTGSIEATQVGTTVSQLFGTRNRIINGAMVIDQRNAGASVTPASGEFITDRFVYFAAQASKVTAQQSTTAPTGFVNSLLVTSSSAYTVGASENFTIGQLIEGLNVSDLGWGTANAQTVTLSFWVRSSLTGTFGGSVLNSASNRSFPFTYTISAANTWEYKTVTIAGDTTGTWLTTNGVGIRLYFNLGAGSTVSGTAGSWSGSTFYSATGATSVVGTNGATWYVTGTQLEIGTSATPFERRLYNQELANCQRYYQKYLSETANGVVLNAVLCSGATAGSGGTQLVTTMRAVPTLSSSGNFQFSDGVTAYPVTSFNLASTQCATRLAQINVGASGGGLTTYRNYRIEANATTTAFLDFSAEL